MTLFVKVFILFVIVCLPEIRTELGEPEVFRDNVTNSSNASTTCHFHILESSRKSVLKLMQKRKTNAIKLNLWTESSNDTITLMNKNQMPTDMLWINELGRTLYSLKLGTGQGPGSNSLISHLPDVTLTAGFRDVNIVVSEDNVGCLLSKNNTMNHAIFDILLHQLYSISDVKTDYQFCHTYNLALNCCRIFPGDKNVQTCSHYSSLVSHAYTIVSYLVAFFSIYFLIPVMVDYLSRFKEEYYYPISSSPMALSYILYVIFIKGRGPVKTRVRKLLIGTFVFVIVLPVLNIDLSAPWTILQYVLFVCWMFIFLNLNFNIDDFSEAYDGNSLLEFITFPFNIQLFCKLAIKNSKTRYVNDESPQTTDHGHGNGNDEKKNFQLCLVETLKIWKYCTSIFIFILLYFISLPILFLSTLLSLNYLPVSIFLPPKPGAKMLERVFRLIFSFSAVCLLWFSITFFFSLIVLFSIGVFLNGETYINYFLPLSTILFFSWTNWKSSVETKYLVLNTSIYEVCKEAVKSNALANSEEEISENFTLVQSEMENDAKNIFVIKLDLDGEPMIPTDLYHLFRSMFLPYHRVLFYYFMGMFVVAVFAYFLYTMLSLSDDSGITSTVQIIGSMAATALPITFNFIWKHSSDEQKEANAIALKSKLKSALKICSSYEAGKILVELKKKKTMDQPCLKMYFSRFDKFSIYRVFGMMPHETERYQALIQQTETLCDRSSVL